MSVETYLSKIIRNCDDILDVCPNFLYWMNVKRTAVCILNSINSRTGKDLVTARLWLTAAQKYHRQAELTEHQMMVA